MVCGDFNLDHNKRSVQNYPNSRLYDEWNETATAFDLIQLIKEDTWSRTCQGTVRTSLLDHANTNVQQLIETTDVVKLEISDHCLITISTKGVMREEKDSYFTYTCWKNYTKEKLIHELGKFDFQNMEIGTVEQMADNFDQTMGLIRERLLVDKTVKRKKVMDCTQHMCCA